MGDAGHPLCLEGSTLFSPAEAVYGAQPVLPGQFLAAEEDPPPPSFFTDLQGILSGRTVLPTQHHSAAAPQQLPEDLLLAKHVLVRRDGHVPPLAAAYDGPFLVLERSLRFFKLQVGDKVDTFSTLRLKPCRSPQTYRLRSRRGGAVRRPPLRSLPDESHLHQQQPRHNSSNAAAASPSAAQSSNHLFSNSTSSASILPAAQPATPDPRDATFSASHTYGVLGLGGSCGKTTIDGGSLYFICA